MQTSYSSPSFFMLYMQTSCLQADPVTVERIQNAGGVWFGGGPSLPSPQIAAYAPVCAVPINDLLVYLRFASIVYQVFMNNTK